MREGVRLFAPQVGEIDRREVLRYMGDRKPNAETVAFMEEAIFLAHDAFSYRACAKEFPITVDGTRVDLGFAVVESADLAKVCAGCESVILFAATVGVAIDRLIARYSRLSPIRALSLQGLGSERIEALCNALCEELAREYEQKGFSLRPRFSAGYGDLPLTLQRDIFEALDCARSIGLTLCDSLLMSPTKSVTAIVGVARKEDG